MQCSLSAWLRLLRNDLAPHPEVLFNLLSSLPPSSASCWLLDWNSSLFLPPPPPPPPLAPRWHHALLHLRSTPRSRVSSIPCLLASSSSCRSVPKNAYLSQESVPWWPLPPNQPTPEAASSKDDVKHVVAPCSRGPPPLSSLSPRSPHFARRPSVAGGRLALLFFTSLFPIQCRNPHHYSLSHPLSLFLSLAI